MNYPEGHGVVSFFLGLVLVVKTLIPTGPDCVKTVVSASVAGHEQNKPSHIEILQV